MEFDLEKVISAAKDLGFKVAVNSEHPVFTFVDKENGSKTRRVTYEQMEKLFDSKFSMNRNIEK